MKINKVVLYYDNFPIKLLTDTRPKYELEAYENREGIGLDKSLEEDGQLEPIIININEYSNGIRLDPGRGSYVAVEPGGARLTSMRKIGWDFCRAILLTFNFMIAYLEKKGFLKPKNINVKEQNLGNYFTSKDSPRFVWSKSFLNG